ncbi:DUF4192 domain-containing protein [Micropruina sp.]|uniref:DUF4192 domain-containing protein n=1 Tax=Micropruina sp. TaxID=2737536 RepID=UPI00262287FF|nr:DUF4192 domain-containing protein [Micropruina sp.]
MTSDTSVPIARVRDLPDLLGVIPHLLGFHPEESMVLVVQDEGQIELTARADLDDLRGAGHLELLIDRMLLRWPSGAIWLVAYTARERQGWRMLRRGRAHLGDALAGDPICVSGHRYRVGSAHGPIYRHDPRAAPTAASATLHGLQARPSRSTLTQLVRADPHDWRAAEDAWVRGLGRALDLEGDDRPDELMRALAEALRAPGQVTRDDLAWLGLLINDPLARDRVVLSLEQPAAEAWVELWSRVVRACPPGTQDQPLAILALAAWVNGDGALQSVCLEEMDLLGIAPGLKQMLEGLNEAVVPPSEWADLRERLRALLEEDIQEAAG